MTNTTTIKYFLSQNEINILRKVNDISEINYLKDLIDIQVGVVTGKNDFFILNKEKEKVYNLFDSTIYLVKRSNYLKGLIFTENDLDEIYNSNLDCKMFYPKDITFDNLDLESQNYIKFGEENKMHSGYKCRKRKKWYIVPSVRHSQGFALRQVHNFPKLVSNKTLTTSSDTVHRFDMISKDLTPERLSILFLNSLTFAVSEIKGRSYGGGVLTFEPSEIRSLPVPIVNSNDIDFNEIDSLLRKNNIDAVLDITDSIILGNGLGFTPKEIETYRAIWKKLRNRRINRK